MLREQRGYSVRPHHVILTRLTGWWHNSAFGDRDGFQSICTIWQWLAEKSPKYQVPTEQHGSGALEKIHLAADNDVDRHEAVWTSISLRVIRKLDEKSREWWKPTRNDKNGKENWERHRDRESQKETQRQRVRERERDRNRESERDTHTERRSEKDRDRDRQRGRERERERQREAETERGSEKDRDRETQKQRERHRDTERERELQRRDSQCWNRQESGSCLLPLRGGFPLPRALRLPWCLQLAR